MPKNVQLPDGRVVEFPDSMSDEQISGALSQQLSAAAPKEPTKLQKVGRVLSDLGRGAEKGWENTVYNAIDLTNRGLRALPSTSIGGVGLTGDALPPLGEKPQELNPTNRAQKIGYTGEQAAEWLVPVGAEGKVASAVASRAPQIARIAVPAAKVATAALEAGARNRLQGGDFTTGAVTGGVMSGVAQGGKAIAPSIAESALGIGKRIRGQLPKGANVGKAVLEDTKSVNMDKLADELTGKIADYSNQVDQLAESAGRQGKTVSLAPARQIVSDETAIATKNQNSSSQAKNLKKLGDQLSVQIGPDGKPNLISAPGPSLKGQPAPLVPEPIPVNVSPSHARGLKQGIGLDISSWNGAEASNIAPTQQRIYGAINEGFHAAVPEAAPLDARMAELIPAYKAASGVANNGGIVQDISQRLSRPTGALVGAAVGGATGAAKGGLPGAILGSAGSLIAPAVAALPETQMKAARILYNPENLRKTLAIIPSARALTNNE